MYALKTRRAFHGWKYLPSLTKTPKNRTTFFSTTCWKFISSKFRGSIPASHSDFNLSLPYPLSHSYNLPIEFLLFTFSSFLSLSIIGWNEINNSSSTMIQPLRRDDIFPSSRVSLKISSHPFQSFLLQPHFLLIIPFHPSLAVLRTDANEDETRPSSTWWTRKFWRAREKKGEISWKRRRETVVPTEGIGSAIRSSTV